MPILHLLSLLLKGISKSLVNKKCERRELMASEKMESYFHCITLDGSNEH